MQMIKKILLVLFFLQSMSIAEAQYLKSYNTAEIQLALKKMNVLGSALYVAAHPDDENTALIAWLANDKLVKTGYLSVTRGDGGQNLIGAEQGELLGIIRTQELLQARNIDGGQQFFTRANDFGFSKNTQEALKVWDKDKVLADVVWAIRKFKPDVIITRFPTTAEAGHGHHSASAVLAIEAFKAAADPTKFPEQLQYVQVWQAKRILWNAFFRRNGNFTNQPPDSIKTMPILISTYNTLLGKTHTVIAAESRSMHKSQGFGSAKNRAERIDYLVHTDGVEAQKDLWEGIDISWGRVQGTQEIAYLLKEAETKFSPQDPSAILPILLKAYQSINQLLSKGQDHWLLTKKEELQRLIIACAGVWYEATAKEYAATAGDSLKITLDFVKFSNVAIQLKGIVLHQKDNEIFWRKENLTQNTEKGKMITFNETLLLPKNLPITQPYWLKQPPNKGMFQLLPEDYWAIGMPENQPFIGATFTIQIGEETLQLYTPILHKWVKPDEGELYRSFQITPTLMANAENQVYMFANDQPKEIKVRLKAGKAETKADIQLQMPEGWRCEPNTQSVYLKNKNEETTLIFKVFPPTNASEATIKIVGKTQEQTQFEPLKGIITIQYPHIPIQTIYPVSEVKAVRLEINKNSTQIGYLEGAGDEIPQCLTQIGYQVTMLNESHLQGDLSAFPTIIVGVRAFNMEEKRWRFYTEALMKYVENGGNLVVQYQTSNGLLVSKLGPYPLTLGRDRVTEEDALMKTLVPDHALLNYPNKITEKDFLNWTQERGLYFASQWDKAYQPILASNDAGEKSLEGGLLYASYGKGRYVYTGLSFFRQLPDGITGAYRLFVNIISPPKQP
ncbi:MAG: PIG-L family deacetylase [Cytophagales bacterium]|nr:MAG: PIG-L family deacetylase [Cytophagales bacterium]